jgi:hypothetical protein
MAASNCRGWLRWLPESPPDDDLIIDDHDLRFAFNSRRWIPVKANASAIEKKNFNS